jgi:hypothetical protein
MRLPPSLLHEDSFILSVSQNCVFLFHLLALLAGSFIIVIAISNAGAKGGGVMKSIREGIQFASSGGFSGMMQGFAGQAGNNNFNASGTQSGGTNLNPGGPGASSSMPAGGGNSTNSGGGLKTGQRLSARASLEYQAPSVSPAFQLGSSSNSNSKGSVSPRGSVSTTPVGVSPRISPRGSVSQSAAQTPMMSARDSATDG